MTSIQYHHDIIIVNTAAFGRVLTSYVRRYNAERPHHGIDLRAPEQQSHAEPEEILPLVRRRDLLGGLTHEYCPVAA